MSLQWFTSDERPDLVDRRAHLVDTWPKFMLESPVSHRCWRLLYERFGGLQHLLVDDATDEPLAEANSVPVAVDLDALPERGWEDVLQRGTTSGDVPNAVSAIAIVIASDRRGEGLSRVCLERMRDAAAEHGYPDLVAPVRPSWKARYPLVDIDRYVAWRTSDGLPFDPWLRVHARAGAKLVRVCHESMTIPGTVREWEAWAGMPFPESGDYVVPGALTPVSIDVEQDRGVYVEPNVWMHHRLAV
jgi:GNAT superfamily N-acetyltransferase